MGEGSRAARPDDDAWTLATGETSPASPALVRRFVIVARVAAALVAITGAGVLVGWAAGIPWLLDPVGHFQRMVPNTAVMFVTSGISLWFASSAAARRCLVIGRALAGACGALAVVTLVEVLLDRDLGIDTLLFDVHPARPAVATSIGLLLSSAAILLLDVRPRRGPALSEILAVAAAVAGALTLGGYVYGATQFYAPVRHPHVVGMAIHTAVALCVLAMGIVAARPSSGAMALVTSPLVGGRVVRKVLPALLSLPVVGYLAVRAQRAGLYDPPGASVVEEVTSVFVAGALTIALGRSLDRADVVRRRMEQENREWKRFFDRATFGAAFGMIDGTLGRINEAFATMHGYAIDELVGRPIADVFPPPRRQELAENIRIAHERGRCRWESEHVRKDGSVFPVVVDLSAIRDEHGRLLYRAAIIQDITAEKEAEAMQARLAALVQSADDAIIAKAPDGTVLDWNRAAERVYGYTAEEMVGRSITTIVPEDRRAERERIRARVQAGDTVVGFETERVRKDGRRIPIALTLSPIRDRKGSVVGISTIERDISAQKRIEADLESARERERAQRTWLEAIIDNSPEGIVVLDERGDVVRQNAAAAALASETGTPSLRGEPYPHDIRDPSGARLASEDVTATRALLAGETTIARELLMVTRSGERVPVLVSAAPVDVDGRRRGAIAIFRDIRALKQLEREREEWASVVAHDLRQPAAAIRLAVDMLPRADELGRQKAVERIRRASDRLDRMIQDLLDVSRIEARRLSLRTERVSVPALIAEVLDNAPHIAIRCRTEVEPGAACAWADAERFVQVLSNLLSNADKYGDPGTIIEVHVERAGAMVQVRVTNEGPGIAPDEIPTLFSRFGRTRVARASTTPGLGLGLYICRGLVEAHGGKLWVESVPGEKTHFQFTLPLASAPEDKLSA